MKKALILLVVLGFCFCSYAEIYVIVDKSTDEIWTVSEKNDTLVPEGKELIIKQGTFATVPFPDAPVNCKLKNGRYIVNSKKISDAFIAKEKKDKDRADDKLIEARMKKIAKDQLIAEGVISE